MNIRICASPHSQRWHWYSYITAGRVCQYHPPVLLKPVSNTSPYPPTHYTDVEPRETEPPRVWRENDQWALHTSAWLSAEHRCRRRLREDFLFRESAYGRPSPRPCVCHGEIHRITVAPCALMNTRLRVLIQMLACNHTRVTTCIHACIHTCKQARKQANSTHIYRNINACIHEFLHLLTRMYEYMNLGVNILFAPICTPLLNTNSHLFIMQPGPQNTTFSLDQWFFIHICL